MQHRKWRAVLWRTVGRLLFRWSPHVAHGWRRRLLRAFGATIAPTTKIRRSCDIDHPWNLSAGRLTIFGDDSVIRARATVSLGERCVVSQMAILTTEERDPKAPGHPTVMKPIVIEDDCWVAADALVRAGAVIRAGTVVGARSVVSGELEGWSVAVGHPARRVKERQFLNARNQ